MGIITRSESIDLAAAATFPPAPLPIKYNNTKIRSQAKSCSTGSHFVSPSPITLKHNKVNYGILTFRRYFSFRTSYAEVRSEHPFSSKSYDFTIIVSDVRNQDNTDVRKNF
jgi:hypothetical protein